MIRQYFNRDVPQLEQGDHLSSAEFNRRYEAMPDLKKAELIDGVVQSGTKTTEHQDFLKRLTRNRSSG